jgi:hypothetical protein
MELWDTYRDEVEFFIVYIREAHALDGRAPLGGAGHPIVEEPVTLAERQELCSTCVVKLALEPIPALVDDIDNRVARAYAAAPDRLYLIGRDGKVAYRGARGPYGFKPDELEAAIRRELGLAEVEQVPEIRE